jgi:hypothetical protein
MPRRAALLQVEERKLQALTFVSHRYRHFSHNFLALLFGEPPDLLQGGWLAGWLAEAGGLAHGSLPPLCPAALHPAFDTSAPHPTCCSLALLPQWRRSGDMSRGRWKGKSWSGCTATA